MAALRVHPRNVGSIGVRLGGGWHGACYLSGTMNSTETTSAALVHLSLSNPGDNIDPETIPESIRAAGGGWVEGRRYICSGCHRDGYFGWRCLERRS